MIELDIETAKLIQNIKPRVKWFDSSIVEYNKRWFVSTSNSKILELNPLDLSIIREFKFPGGWAIGTKPIIHNDLLIASNYGARICIIDLKTNKIVKRINKTTGSKPYQTIIGDYVLFYDGNIGQELSMYSLDKYKKKWKKTIERIQFICTPKNVKPEIIFKNNDKYVIGELDIDKCKVGILDIPLDFEQWSEIKYDLWSGAGIVRNDSYSVYAFEPNKIVVRKQIK